MHSGGMSPSGDKPQTLGGRRNPVLCENRVMCDSVQENVNDYPLLKDLLPDDYRHHICSYRSLGGANFRAHLRLQLASEDEVHRWLEDFQKSSGLTWRKSKTYPDVGRGSNKYRVDLRCHHNTRTSTSKVTKNTFCAATMYLVLKRQCFSKGRTSRSEDPHITNGFFFGINLRNEHNHQVPPAGPLRSGDVLRDTCDKLQTLLQNGHSPSSALETLKGDLQEQEVENYAYPEDTVLDCGLDAVETDSGTSGMEEDLTQVFDCLKQKLRYDPTFKAPVMSFISGFNQLETDCSLRSALSSFSKGPTVKTSQRAKRHQATALIGVCRKTALGRRTSKKTGRKTSAPH